MIIQGLTNSFKAEMLQAVHDLSTDTLKLALFTSGADLTPATTAYSATNEVVASGYTAGGVVLTGVTISIETVPNVRSAVVYVDFDDVSIAASITARGALIYNASKADRSVAVLNFGSEKTANPFSIQMPANTAQSALIRFP